VRRVCPGLSERLAEQHVGGAEVNVMAASLLPGQRTAQAHAGTQPAGPGCCSPRPTR
jgi:hypothetical protein